MNGGACALTKTAKFLQGGKRKLHHAGGDDYCRYDQNGYNRAGQGKEYDYGDWGDVVGLAACTAVGRSDREERCFYIEFSNGFLPVVFAREDMAPTGNLDESLFEYTDSEKLNSIALQDGAVVHTRLVETKGEMNQGNYYDADDTLVLSVDAEFIEETAGRKMKRRKITVSFMMRIRAKRNGTSSAFIAGKNWSGN